MNKLSILILSILLVACATPESMQNKINSATSNCKVAIGMDIGKVSECLEREGLQLKSRASWYKDYESWVKENGDVLHGQKCGLYYHPLMSSCSWVDIVTNKNGVITKWETGSGFDMP